MPPRLPFEPEAYSLPPALVGFMTAWFFYLGACVGSFMNVVIYRVPLGMSVVSPRSRCPRCGHAIRGFDNLPVLSWLILRGRCRDCSLPIPVRYPLVEFLVGLLFMLMAIEVIQPNGPWWLLNIASRDFLTVPWPKLIAAFAYYQLGLCTLICAAYIAWDGERAPLPLFVPAILAGLAFPAYWNEIRPLATSAPDWQTTIVQGLLQGALGALVGAVLGWTYDQIRNLRNARGEPRGRMLLPALTLGLMLGWQVAAIAVIVASVLAKYWLVLWRKRWPATCAAPVASLCLVAIGLVLAGRVVFEIWPRFVARDGWGWLVTGLLLLVLSSYAARRWGAQPEPLDASEDVTSHDFIYP